MRVIPRQHVPAKVFRAQRRPRTVLSGCHANRHSIAAPASLLSLTPPFKQEIMFEPGIRSTRVRIFTPSQPEESHDRLQPQGRRRVGARQPNDQRRDRAPGERNSGISFSRRSVASLIVWLTRADASSTLRLKSVMGLLGL